MVRICVVEACGTEYYPDCGLSFHRFPKDPNVREIWINVIPMSSTRKLTDASVVCSKHFKAQDYVACLSRPVLKCYAVPSVFLLSAPMLQGSPEPAVADSTHEEPHSDDSVVDAEDATARFAFSWEKPSDAIPCADESERSNDSSSVRSCVARDDEIKSESHDDKFHLDVKCNECGGEIIGYRYTCVQCCDVDLCGACEASGAHPEHYVLRLPRPEPTGAVKGVLETLRGLLKQEPLVHLPQEQIKMEVDENEDPLHESTNRWSPVSTNDETDDIKSEGQVEEQSDLETLSIDSKETHTDGVVVNTARVQHQTNDNAASNANVSTGVKKKLLPIIRVSKCTQVKTLVVDSGVIKFGSTVGSEQIGGARTSTGTGVGISVAGVTVPAGGVRVPQPTVGRQPVPASEASVRLTGADVKVSSADITVPGAGGMVSRPTTKRTAVVKLKRLETTALEEAERRKVRVYFDTTKLKKLS